MVRQQSIFKTALCGILIMVGNGIFHDQLGLENAKLNETRLAPPSVELSKTIPTSTVDPPYISEPFNKGNHVFYFRAYFWKKLF